MAQKNNRIVVPEAKEAMEQFKMQAANEVGAQMELEQKTYGITYSFRKDPHLWGTAEQCGSFFGFRFPLHANLPRIMDTLALHEQFPLRSQQQTFPRRAVPHA